jgi:hypothetical protein
MATLFTKDSTRLASRQTASGIARQATIVRVTKGCVWLTIAGRQQDYWLYAGDSMVVPARLLTVIEAAGGEAQVDIQRCRKSLLTWLRSKQAQMPIARIVLHH